MGCILPVYTCVAALDASFKEAFPDVIQNLCASSIEYDLMDTESGETFEEKVAAFEKKRWEYHQKINCILNEATAGAMQSVNTLVEKEAGNRFLSLDTPPEVSEECQGVFAETQAVQENLRRSNDRPRTSCDPTGENPNLQLPYSSCRVAEMMLTEWCGYQKYLWAKKKDDTAFLETGSRLKKFSDLAGELNPLDDFLAHEFDKSRRTLQDIIFFYQEFEQNYRLHAWLRAIHPALRITNNTIARIRGVINTFPTKFINQQRPSP